MDFNSATNDKICLLMNISRFSYFQISLWSNGLCSLVLFYSSHGVLFTLLNQFPIYGNGISKRDIKKILLIFAKFSSQTILKAIVKLIYNRLELLIVLRKNNNV